MRPAGDDVQAAAEDGVVQPTDDRSYGSVPGKRWSSGRRGQRATDPFARKSAPNIRMPLRTNPGVSAHTECAVAMRDEQH